MASLRISCSLSYNSVVRTEFHGFCDASKRGYRTVFYLCIVRPKETHIRLLIANSKEAPLKSLSLFRLELCAALLLSNFLNCLEQALKDSLIVDVTFAWSNSMVALAWIRSSPHKLETFVRNRVTRIQENTAAFFWDHMGTNSNSADHCSKELFPQETHGVSFMVGPDWLQDFNSRA